MPKVVIVDTSVLIVLSNIKQLELLHKTYGTLLTTPEVAKEFGEVLPPWITIQEVTDDKYQNLLEIQVDKGEASAIGLALTSSLPTDVLLLLDDLKARKLAAKLNMRFTGTLGIIHKAKQLGVIDSVRPLLEKIQNTNFHISGAIVTEILQLNNEL